MINQVKRFNDGWEFAKSSLDREDCSGLSFEPVDLPHDWLIYNTLDLYEDSIGWYRKMWSNPGGRQQQVLVFDGVYMDSTVYVNGRQVGEWKYGYSSFEVDLTDALVDGINEIMVKVVHQSPNSRWYSGAGIYRNVWLKSRDQDHIVSNGIYITTQETDEGWTVEVDTELQLAGSEKFQLSHTLVYKGEEVAGTSELLNKGAAAAQTNRQTLVVDSPYLWSPDAPHLYKLVTELKRVDAIEECLELVGSPVGFRTIVMDPSLGLYVNGIKMKLNGVCEHHDFGAIGAVFNRAAQVRRLQLLKNMGVNAIRTAHNMPAPELMELADEMGFFVVSEAFDMWERPKTPYDYARFFKDWAAKDVASWVRRDRNHPSLLMWSIGNEIYDTHADERGQEVTRFLRDEVRRHDPKENAGVTIGSNFMPWENAQKCADLVKLAGYNYAEKYYRQHHEQHPDWIIYGSETASVVQSRGIYHFPFEKPILADDDEQCSALGNSTTSWGAKSPEACILAERDSPFSLGQFLWTGFDYIGEPTPYHTKNSYFGQLDTATFPKDSYYIYQSGWTDYKTRPMVHLFPYWDFNPGQIIDVRICSNAPKVELLLNGASLGVQELEHKTGSHIVGWWKVPYEVGELKAVAYDDAGKIIAEQTRCSFGDVSRIVLTPDKTRLAADGEDLVFVEISMEDEQGNPVENATNRVQVEVTGVGRLLGLDNGDSTDYDPYKGTSRRLFSGKLMAVVGAGFESGEIQVRVSSVGMESQELVLEAFPVGDGAKVGLTANTRNTALPCVMGREDEIPVRKMEITSESGQQFNVSCQEKLVRVNLHPANTSYRDVEWSAVDDAGIVTNIAKVEADGLMAKVTALGDGHFRLRCTSRNGTDKTKLISQLEFTVTGLGTAYKDPYGFVAGGLYDSSLGDVGNGNDRGVATSRDGESCVTFLHLDFGPYGSDTMTIPIFALSSEPYELEIWEGVPGEEGSSLLADVVYEKETIWNVYQEETYRLSKWLRGVTSISFVTRQKIHIKGFTFERQSRAFERNAALECDRLYGDSFVRTETAVEGIGNNVSLEYEGLDFGAEGTGRLVVCGRTPLDRNTIQIRCEGPEGSSSQVVEFTRSEEYEEQSFELGERVTGVRRVTFLFLPGAQFDFGWFRFER